MKTINKPIVSALAVFCVIAQATAGDTPPPPQKEKPKYSFLTPVGDFIRDDILDPVEPFQLVPGKDPNGWGFVIEPYLWAMGLSGDVGAKGLPPASLAFSSRRVIQNLDLGIFARGEIRKGRWGVLADGYYAALSGSASLDNRIYENASLNLQQSVVSLALAYRVIDDRRGFLDIYGGARYNYLGLQLEASLNESRITTIANNVTDAIGTRIQGAVDAAIAQAVDAAKSRVAERVDSVSIQRNLRLSLERNVDLRDLIRAGLIRNDLTGGGVREALRQYIAARAEAKVAAAAGRASARLEAAASSAKRRLSKALARRITDSTPTYTSGDQWWIDPIIGLRGQIHFTRWLYLAAQADVGGFSAGSRIAWNVQSTIGINFTRNIFAELGYRYFYVDYENDGFVYNMNSYGVFSSIGFKF
ncbi:MAG: hypothetical protein WEB60_11820 [Terrimicrobiaceae bacterium]